MRIYVGGKADDSQIHRGAQLHRSRELEGVGIVIGPFHLTNSLKTEPMVGDLPKTELVLAVTM